MVNFPSTAQSTYSEPPVSLQRLQSVFPEMALYMPLAPAPQLPGYQRFTRPNLPPRANQLLNKVLGDLAEWREIPEATNDADLLALHLIPLVRDWTTAAPLAYGLQPSSPRGEWDDRYNKLVEELVKVMVATSIQSHGRVTLGTPQSR